MIKLTKEMAKHVLIAMQWTLSSTGEDLRAAVNALRGRIPRPHGIVQDAMRNVSDNEESVPLTLTLTHIINSITRSAPGMMPQTDTINLMDQIAALIAGDIPRNRLSGETLLRLQNLLLQPDEVAFMSELRGDLSCAQCGGAFQENEMAVRAGGGFLCTACRTPTLAKCAFGGCTDHKAIRAAMVCKTHQR